MSSWLCTPLISIKFALKSRCKRKQALKVRETRFDDSSASSINEKDTDDDDEDHHDTHQLHPAVADFKNFIESRPRLHMHFRQMWQETLKPDVEGHVNVRDYDHMLELLSRYIQQPPPWSPASWKMGSSGLPFNDMFYYAVLTPSGYAAFTDAEVARQVKKLLMVWYHYLRNEKSRVGLHTWLSKENGCLGELVRSANEAVGTNLKFEEMFECDAEKEFYGFGSWDAFFIRRFRDGLRPVCQEKDAIVNACESMPLSLVRGVKLQDEFWMKGSVYSLVDMFDDRNLAMEFEGGTVYQGFLSQYSYHRWHAPVQGVVRHCYRIDGTYFAVPRFAEEYCLVETGHLEVERCMASMSCLSSRAVIVIEADDPAIGTVAFIAVGLHEVSTTELTIKKGQRVKRGQEMGMFHYGGSTHCLVFQKDIVVDGFPMDTKVNVPVNGPLARIKSRSVA
ncbi:unnamed protein product [Cercospora beticola]|nr:unnamed protein product [Cercospora beticola]